MPADIRVQDTTGAVSVTGTVANGVDVDVTRLPALVAGTANIGDVDVASIAAGETHIGQSTWPMVVVEVTATVDTSAYTSGDVLTDTMTLVGALRAAGKGARLRSVIMLDEDDEAAFAVDIYFFKATQNLNTKNNAPNIADAGMRDCLGVVSLATTDAKDIGTSKIYTKMNLDLPLVATAGTDVFASAVVTGTPTFTAATDIKFKFGIEQH